MNRLTFIGLLSGLCGAAKAQQWKECMPEATVPAVCTDKMKPARNNQCPVCGTMAEAWKPPSAHMLSHSSESVTRCKRCNAAFWQDSV